MKPNLIIVVSIQNSNRLSADFGFLWVLVDSSPLQMFRTIYIKSFDGNFDEQAHNVQADNLDVMN